MAAPLLLDHSSSVPAQYSEDPQAIIGLLLTGMTDQAVARELGLSKRTLARRIRDLLSHLEADTRFQAGFKLGLEAGNRS